MRGQRDDRRQRRDRRDNKRNGLPNGGGFNQPFKDSFRPPREEPQFYGEAQELSDTARKEMMELLKHNITMMVDNPDRVEISPVQGEQTLNFEVKVAKADLGKVIGQKGRNAQALRTILQAVAAKYHVRSVLNIIE